MELFIEIFYGGIARPQPKPEKRRRRDNFEVQFTSVIRTFSHRKCTCGKSVEKGIRAMEALVLHASVQSRFANSNQNNKNHKKSRKLQTRRRHKTDPEAKNQTMSMDHGHLATWVPVPWMQPQFADRKYH